MKKRRANRVRQYWMLKAMLLVILVAFCDVAGADNDITATLKSSTTLAKRGQEISFSAEVFHNPAFEQPPGTIMRCWVTRCDFSWVSDKIDITYPNQGQKRSISFKNKFTIPQNANVGQVFDFVLVYGIWYPISEKVSVKVIFPIFKQGIIKKTQNND